MRLAAHSQPAPTRLVGLATSLLMLVALMVVTQAPAGAAIDGGAEQGFLERINAARGDQGRAALTPCKDLRAAARDHSRVMADEQRLHHNPDLGSDVTHYRRAGENVGRGGSVDSLHRAFMDSEGHRRNALDKGYRQVGIGVDERNGTLWVTVVFREPKPAATCKDPGGFEGSGGSDDATPAPAPSERAEAGQQLLGDLTGDGVDELVRLDGEGAWHVTRDGVEQEWGSLPSPSGWQHLIADIDDDGRDELVSYRTSDGAWYASEAAGGRLETRKVYDFKTPDGWQHLAADVTGDGHEEIVSYHSHVGSWYVLRPDGDVLSAEKWNDFKTADGWEHLAADLDGDGQDEIVSYHRKVGSWYVSTARQERTGWFSKSWSGFDHERWGRFRTLKGWQHLVADVTGDGRDEIVSYHERVGSWYVQVAAGGRFDLARWNRFKTARGWQHTAGDVTGNGVEEIVSYHAGAGTWYVSRSDGASLRESRWGRFRTRDGWLAHLVGDVDGNGIADVASFRGPASWRLSTASSQGFAQQDL